MQVGLILRWNKRGSFAKPPITSAAARNLQLGFAPAPHFRSCGAAATSMNQKHAASGSLG